MIELTKGLKVEHNVEISMIIVLKNELGLPHNMKSSFTHISYDTILIIFCFVLTFPACQNTFKPNPEKLKPSQSKEIDLSTVSDLLQKKFDTTLSVSEVLFGDSSFAFKEYQRCYVQNEYKPLWITEDGLPIYTKEMLESIKGFSQDAIDVSAYKSDDLIQRFSTLSPSDAKALLEYDLEITYSFFKATRDMLLGTSYANKSNKEWKNKNDTLFNAAKLWKEMSDANDFSGKIDSLRPQHPWYRLFMNEYQRLKGNNFIGLKINKESLGDSLLIGNSYDFVPDLRKKLNSEVSIPSDTSSAIWDDSLKLALKKYQFIHQIKPSGKIDTTTLVKLTAQNNDNKVSKLALSMERMRWLRHTYKQPYIWVNIPQMEVNYIEQDSVQFNMRAVVGRVGRPTPTLDAKLENIVFSPPWVVPPTIMKEEIVPGIARRGGSYLARRGLKAYDSRGRVVNASAINASNYKRFSIGQAPGYRSSLGEVKFNMPNPWSIYMHDTPHREDFVKHYRAYSSGCVRVHHPKQFAEFLLRDTTNYSYGKIDSICKLRKTIFVPMKRDINVHLVYLTASVDSAGNVMYLKDIYNWDKEDLSILKH